MSVPRKHARKGTECQNCLWSWPEVHGGEGTRCYCQSSDHYHQPWEAGCRQYARRVSPLKTAASWGTPGLQQRRKGKGRSKYDG